MKYLYIALLFLLVNTAIGQSSKYHWVNALTATSSAVDSTFTTQWEMCVIYSDTVDIYLRIGAPDVASWTSRDWMLLPSGEAYSIGPYPKLKKLSYKTKTGTGTLYLVGYKKVRQY